MRRISAPELLEQSTLFDLDQCGWWLTQLAPEALAKLRNGLEGYFRSSILKLLPADQLGESFDPLMGRPTKELYAVCGLLLLAEFRDWTIEQAANAWSFDASVQFALNLPRDGQHISGRTIDGYRRLLRESEQAQAIFEKVTTEIVRTLQVAIKKQRLDSTHVLSDKARDANGQGSHVLQNPSDPGAGYDGHKGAGYKAQIVQAYDTGEKGLGIITACMVQSAGDNDGGSLQEIHRQQQRMGTTPETMLADTAYGGHDEVEAGAARGVKLIAPVAGRAVVVGAQAESVGAEEPTEAGGSTI